MSLEENFETYLKEKYANEEKDQNTETDNPNFRVGFLQFLQKDGHEEDNSSRQTQWKRRRTSGKNFKRFANSRSMEILM